MKWSGLFSLVVAVGAMSCAAQRAESGATEVQDGGLWPEAAVEILSAEVEGDTLRLTVQYGGGCAEHALSAVAAGPMLKSLPPKQPIRVVHRTPGDPCRALIEELLAVDLTPWRGTPNGVTVLLLENWNEPLIYEYD